jgi:hypothetical protein
MCNSLKEWWAALELHNKFYLVATILFLLTFVLLQKVLRSLIPLEIALLPSELLFVAGYLIWWVPEFLRVWRSDTGRLPLILIHAALYPACAGIARLVVSKATGLPPQSLDLTVSFLALLSYPIIWGCIFALISILYGAYLFIYSMLLSTDSTASGTDQTTPSENHSWWTGSHALGAIATCGLITFSVQNYENYLYSEPFVRLIAYFLDFEYAAKYPGIDHDRRMRLLDNQYAAYAEIDGWDAKITVKKLIN